MSEGIKNLIAVVEIIIAIAIAWSLSQKISHWSSDRQFMACLMSLLLAFLLVFLAAIPGIGVVQGALIFTTVMVAGRAISRVWSRRQKGR